MVCKAWALKRGSGREEEGRGMEDEGGRGGGDQKHAAAAANLDFADVTFILWLINMYVGKKNTYFASGPKTQRGPI